MMRRFILAALAALGLMAGGHPAAAQYFVVAACPNLAAVYATGQSNRVAAIDIYGTVCTSGSGGGGGGAVTIANGADVAEGSTTDAPATTPTTVAPATTIALLKALNNGVTISNFPATQPISGTVTANQGGTWTVQPGNTPNTVPWLVTSSSAIAPISTMNSATSNSGMTSAMAGVFDDVTPTSIAENNFGYVRMSANRNQYTTLRDAAGNERGVNVTAANALTVDASATTQPVSAASLPLPTGAATSAAQTTMATNQTAVQTPVAPATATATKGELLGCQYNTPAVVFTNGQQGSIACGPSGEFLISGTVASGATDSGNPVKVGAIYKSTPLTLTDGQRSDATVGTRQALRMQLEIPNSVLGAGTASGWFDGVATSANAYYMNTFPYLFNGTTADRPRSDSGTGAATGAALNVPAPTASATNAIAPVVAGSASSSAVLKASAGNLYSAYATCTAACWLMAFNATSAPADGATTAGIASGNLQDCIPIASGGVGSLGANGSPPEPFTVGITLVISSTACATKTASTVGFIHGSAK